MDTYTLIITEKPAASRRIAEALDRGGNPSRFEKNGVPYFIAHRDKPLVIVPALGHLYTVIGESGDRNRYPVFDFKWAPRYLAERGATKIRRWLAAISELANHAGEFLSACDNDIEGSLIGYSLLKYACGNKEHVAKRMKFSTLTKDDLEKAYENPAPSLDFALIEAGMARHEVDWLYGVNLSRALTLAARHWSGKHTTLSTGRVQGPALKSLFEREKSIRSFVPTPYWEVKAEVEINQAMYSFEHEKKRIALRSEAGAITRACTNKTGEIKTVDVTTFQQRPPPPFDLGTLQTEAYALFGYAPKQTLDAAQRLYLDALISYPRTSSQKLPAVIGFKRIFAALRRKAEYAHLISELLDQKDLRPKEGVKEDPAHPAIYPTGTLPRRLLNKHERSVWDLIVRRFLAVFGKPALKQNVKVCLGVKDHRFFLKGSQILAEGWMRFYKPYVLTKDVLLPDIKAGETYKLKRVFCVDKFTTPPHRYTASSLLRKMEALRIGTKATRANIIETLYNRKYITGKRIVVAELGFHVIEVLSKYVPKVTSATLTQELENKMEQIRNNQAKKATLLLEVIEQLKPQLKHFKENEGTIGPVLSRAIKRARTQERIIGNCPDCGTGSLLIVYSKRTKKRFIGCTNYFNGTCQTSFPLPQRGRVRPTKKGCGTCGWPLVQIRGRRNWRLCFNPRCPSKR